MTGLLSSWSMPSVGSGIYSSGTGGQPFNSRGAYHQNPCPEVYLFSVQPRALRWPASDPHGVHRMLGRECRAVPVARLVLPATLMGYTVVSHAGLLVYQTVPNSEWLGNRSLTLMDCTAGYATDDLFV